MKQTMKRTFSAFAAAALAAVTVAVATPAFAQENDSVAISVADLDLSDPGDSARFERRVRQAARTLCGDHQLQTLDMRGITQACHDSVISNARADAQVALAKNSGPFRLTLRTN
jgi:UrcA family protein